LEALTDELTIGLVVHPENDSSLREHQPGQRQHGSRQHGQRLHQHGRDSTDGEEFPLEVLCGREGVWQLSLDASRRLAWQINTTAGVVVAKGKTVLSPTAGGSYVVKATFNGSLSDAEGKAKLFIASVQDGASTPTAVIASKGALLAASPAAAAATLQPGHGVGVVVGRGFAGSLEELYIKNVSTEARFALVTSCLFCGVHPLVSVSCCLAAFFAALLLRCLAVVLSCCLAALLLLCCCVAVLLCFCGAGAAPLLANLGRR
jgi:hypothetical protein